MPRIGKQTLLASDYAAIKKLLVNISKGENNETVISDLYSRNNVNVS